jgi:hypothetical protein
MVMVLLKRDNNELRYNSIWLLEKRGNPDYYKQLIRNAKGLFYGLEREDLVKELDKYIKYKIENKMGAKIQYVLLIYKNLPYLNSYTRSKIIGNEWRDIHKYDLETWLDEIEKWIFQHVIVLEPEIIFSTPPRQFI